MRSKPILIAILSVVFLFGVALVAGWFMPGTWRAEARTTIQAAPETVHPWIGDVERWPQWFPWNASKDPSVRYEFPGPRSGVGAVLVWKSEKVGHGTMTLTRSDPRTGVAYDLVFQNSRQPATASAKRAAPASMSCRLEGSGSMARSVGAIRVGTVSSVAPRAARMRPSSSGRSWVWLMAAASRV
jgi:hypothetical protein